MNDTTIKLRVPGDDLEKWKILAAEAQVSLSEWIRLKCAGAVDTSVVIPQYTDFRGTEALAETPVKCTHDYGPKACPFPGCRNNKWDNFAPVVDRLDSEPVYKSHPKNCTCVLCSSARQAGLK